jgi:beta-lactamase regulating signal transducer with metallopeptidase domain
MMASFFTSHAHWIALVGQSVFSAAWEGVLLVCCVALCLKLLPGMSASARSIVWIAMMALLAALPFVPQTHVGPSGNGVGLKIDIRWAWLLSGIWAAWALVRLALLIRSAWHVHRVSVQSIELSADELVALHLDDMETTRFRHVRICSSSQVGVPCVAGFFRPRVLLPPSLLHSLSSTDMKQVVQHELEHLRRRDDWVNLLQKTSLVFLPLNPGLWWVERRLCVERELACDDCVLELTGAPKAYAVCLANLAETSMVQRNVSLVLGAWRRRSELAKRIYRILQAPSERWGRAATATAVSLLLIAVSTGAFVLGRTVGIVSFSGPQMTSQPVLHLYARAAVPAEPIPAASAARTMLVSAISPHHSALATHRVQHELTEQTNVVATVERSERRTGSTGETLVVWKKSSVHRIRPTIASEDSQFTYAAIPLPDGWLIVQL